MKANDPEEQCLEGRVILVTGAASGIGHAVVCALAAFGATTVLLDYSLRGLEETYDKIENAGYPQPAIYPLNLETATQKDYLDLADKIHTEFGQLDGLLHNAAKLGYLTPLDEYDAETWYEVMQVNLNAPFMLTQACLPLLKKSDDASIVFTTDHEARKHDAYWGAYGISKHAIDGMMITLAEELKNTSVRVNSIDPGPVRTNLRQRAFPAEPREPLALPESITKHYVYLLGPESKDTTKSLLCAHKIL